MVWISFSRHVRDLHTNHDDVIKWKHFPRYWPFVRGIHRSPVNSPHRPVTRNFDAFFDLHPNKLLSKQSWGWWLEKPSRSLQRHRNDCFHGLSEQRWQHDVGENVIKKSKARGNSGGIIRRRRDKFKLINWSDLNDVGQSKTSEDHIYGKWKYKVHKSI